MFNGIKAGNTQRTFDALQRQRLGNYVYVLMDPRDKKIFYVGQGKNDRIFDHFSEAEVSLNADKNVSSKIVRILDIWNNDLDVQWYIVAHGVAESALSIAESIVIDSLSISPNGLCLNDIGGPDSSMLTDGEVKALGAKPFNPSSALGKVFIFPVHNAFASSPENIYEATRASWSVSENHRSGKALAVGIKNGISVGGFNVEKWVKDGDKYAFEGTTDQALENYDWTEIISGAKGYWQYGNYLVAEFDGNGKYKIVKGCKDKEWQDIGLSNAA